MKMFASTAWAWLFLAMSTAAYATPLTVDFDALNAVGGPVGGAPLDNYLSTFGITLSGITGGTQVSVFDQVNIYGGTAVDAPSDQNVLMQHGMNGPISFTVNFGVLQDYFSFTRAGLIPHPSSGITHPAWTAYAYDALNNQVDIESAGVVASYSYVPPQTYTLTGPSIAKVTFSANNVWTAFSNVVLDDFVLPNGAPNPIPEPGSLMLAGIGIVAVGGFRLIRRRRQATSAD